MRNIIVKLMYFWWSFKQINKPHLGDVVKIKSNGKIHTLIQGVADPYWDIMQRTCVGSIRINNVHKSRFELKHPIMGRIQRLKESYKFQMQNWYRIDCNTNKWFKRISYHW